MKPHEKLEKLRSAHPTLHYQAADFDFSGDDLVASFTYLIEPDLEFRHQLVFEKIPDSVKQIPEAELRTYTNHLGMAEIFNYWKLTASPIIHNHVVSLSKEQSDFWHHLLINGMGEYFYVNQIDFTDSEFVKFVSDFSPNTPKQVVSSFQKTQDRILIPLGGGKDSVVTMTIFQKNLASESLGVLLINPTLAASQIASQSGLQTIKVTRKIDPKLLEFNNQGFLNGHVPISSVFAFISSFAARLHGFSHVAISNERSSNEGNVVFLNREINHQYSKSYDFESRFRQYQQSVFSHDPTGHPSRGQNHPEYFSFLRPLFELQIARLFSQMSDYHSIFRSCNRGQKTNIWCGECPKCLFAYTMLYPFIGQEKAVTIFGKDLFEDENLYPLSLALLGKDKNKPFECVGTYEETLSSFYLCAKRAKKNSEKNGTKLPVVLDKINQEVLYGETNLDQRAQSVLSDFNQHHFLTPEWQKWLQAELNQF